MANMTAIIVIDNYNQLMVEILRSKNIFAEFMRNKSVSSSFVVIEILNLVLNQFVALKDDALELDLQHMKNLLACTLDDSGDNNKIMSDDSNNNELQTSINIFYLLPNWELIASLDIYKEIVAKFYKVINRIEPTELKIFLCKTLIFYKRITHPLNFNNIDAHYIDEEECIRVETMKSTTRGGEEEEVHERKKEVRKRSEKEMEIPPIETKEMEIMNNTLETANGRPKGILRAARRNKTAPPKSVSWNHELINGQRIQDCMNQVRKSKSTALNSLPKLKMAPLTTEIAASKRSQSWI